MGLEGGLPIKMYAPPSEKETGGGGSSAVPTIRFNADALNRLEEVASSRTTLSIKKLKAWIDKNEGGAEALSSEQAIIEAVSKNRLLLPGVSAMDVVTELRKLQIISDPPKEKAKPAAPEHIQTEKIVLEGLKELSDTELKTEVHERISKDAQIKEAKKRAQVEKRQKAEEKMTAMEKDVFRNPHDLDTLHAKSLSLFKENTVENDDDYYAFAGLVPGGRAEIEQDLLGLKEIEGGFDDRKNEFLYSNAEQTERKNKIATITEQVLIYSVDKLDWYGQNVRIGRTSRFDDVRRGVDSVLEIERRQQNEKSYLGLGVDVTYGGLWGDAYENKIKGTLKSMHEGYKTKVKYYKNQSGMRMREFAIPKAILHFNGDEVKEMANLVRHLDDESVVDQFKKSSIKIEVLNQIMIQCELFAEFAELSGNTIAMKYREVANSIGELGVKNEAIRTMLAARHEDDTTERIRTLIEEYKKENRMELREAA